MPTLKEAVSVIEELAPPGLAAEWDNSGLQVGEPASVVKRVLVALDPTAAVMAEAKALSCELLVTHHPLFFRAAKSLDLSRGQGAVVHEAVKNGIAVYSAHTSLDRIPGGVSEALAGPLGLKVPCVIRQAEGWPAGYGFGRVGYLPQEMKLSALADRLKSMLGVERVRVVGDPDMAVKRLALCGGSGSDLMEEAFYAGADAFVTGDLKYHEALHAGELGLAVLDVGHFQSERPVVAHLAGLLAEAFAGRGWDVEVRTSQGEREPWSWL